MFLYPNGVPAGQKTNAGVFEFIASGTSMHPTFRSGDLLEVVPCPASQIACGDVIVFRQSGNGDLTAHRVSSIAKEGFITRGDNSSTTDLGTVSTGQLIGKVAFVFRGKKRRKIWGGRAGQWSARFFVLRRAIIRIVSRLLRHPYRFLARVGVFRWLLPRRIRPKVISFTTDRGPELRLIMMGRMIGRLGPGESVWSVRRPFRVFVDERRLAILRTSPDGAGD